LVDFPGVLDSNLHQTHHSNNFPLPSHQNFAPEHTANMSDWVGPGLYRIESYKDRGVAIAVKDGKNVVLK
jgi:hypothetical protein